MRKGIIRAIGRQRLEEELIKKVVISDEDLEKLSCAEIKELLKNIEK